MSINKYTTQEVLNKVYTDESDNTISLQAQTAKETLNAVLSSGEDSLNVSLAGSNTITGDVTISGDLTVQGGGSQAFDEIVQGTMSITTADNSTQLSLISTDEDANVGPALELYRNSASPANSDLLGTVYFFGEDGAGNKEQYARIESVAGVKGSGSEEGVLNFYTNNAGTLTNNRLAITGSETVINESSGNFDFRVESNNNANMLFVDAGNDNVGIGTVSPKHYSGTTGTVLSVHSATHRGILELSGASNSDDGLVGAITFANTENTSANGALAQIFTYVETSDSNGDSDSGGHLAFSTRPDGGTITERMRIDSSGNVGIGASSPTSTRKMTIQEATSQSSAIHFTDTDTMSQGIVGNARAADDIVTGTANNDFVVGSTYNKPTHIITNNTIRTTIDSSGNVGIGISNPNAPIDVSTSGESGTAMIVRNTSTIAMAINANADGSFRMFDYVGGGYNGSITSQGGRVGIGTGSPATNTKFHVADGIGTLPAFSSGDLAVFQNNDNTGDIAVVTILSGNAGSGYLVFGDAEDKNRGRIQYDHSNNSMKFATNDSDKLTIDSSGDLQLQERLVFSGTNDTVSGPSINLHSNNYLYIAGGSSGVIIGDDSSASRMQILDNSDVQFEVAGSVKFKMDTNSKISLSNNDSNTGNTVFGKSAFNANTTDNDYNTVFGELAMGTGTSSSAANNTAIGYKSLEDITGGTYNTAVGSQSGVSITSGSYNTIVGQQALTTALTAGENVSIGYRSMFLAEGGESQNVAIGVNAMKNVQEGSGGGDADYNIAIGYNALTGGDFAGNNYQLRGNIAIGGNAMIATGANAQTGTIAIGEYALTALTSGGNNTAIGYSAGTSLTIGDHNIILGHNALFSEVGGQNSVAIGSSALYTQTVADAPMDNIGIGRNAGYNNATGTKNTYVGSFAGQGTSSQSGSNITGIGFEALKVAYGQDNVAVGAQAGLAITSGVRNCLIGNNTGDSITDANYVTAVGIFAGSAINHTDANGTTLLGYSAGLNITSGNGNTAVGYEALKTNVDGDRNTAVGYGALVTHEADADGHGENSALGYQAGGAINTGTGNTLIGSRAGNQGTNDITTGDNNTMIGVEAKASASAGINQIVIGHGATGQTNNSVTLGNGNVTDVYMNQDSGAKVHCLGIDIQESSLSTADSYRGFYHIVTKTGGDSNTGDDYQGIYNQMNWNQSDTYGVLGGIYNSSTMTTGGTGSSFFVGLQNQTIQTNGNCNNLYGIWNKIDVDNGTVDEMVKGIYTDIDIDGGTFSDYIFGDYLTINTTQNPSSAIRARQISLGGAGVDATNDIFWYLYDTQNADVVAQVTALEGVATFDSGDFEGAPDYAEYFESKDGKPIAIGSTVKLDGDKIVACSDGDTPMGVVRPKSSSAVVANCATTRYQGKYLKTDYDEIILEDYKIIEWTEEITFEEYSKSGKDETGGVLGGTVKDSKVVGSEAVKAKDAVLDEDGKELEPAVEAVDAVPNKYYRKHSYHSDRLPSGVTPPSDAVELTPAHQRKKLNPDYDPSKVYKNRKERDEWCLIGLLGQIPITKGQPIASNWIKMKDVSDKVEMYFVK